MQQQLMEVLPTVRGCDGDSLSHWTRGSSCRSPCLQKSLLHLTPEISLQDTPLGVMPELIPLLVSLGFPLEIIKCLNSSPSRS